MLSTCDTQRDGTPFVLLLGIRAIMTPRAGITTAGRAQRVVIDKIFPCGFVFSSNEPNSCIIAYCVNGVIYIEIGRNLAD
jgi:hypothetical protein